MSASVQPVALDQPGSGVHVRHDSNEYAIRRALAFDCNLLIVELKKAIGTLEHCRGVASREGASLGSLSDVGELMGDATRLVGALNVAVAAAADKMGGT